MKDTRLPKDRKMLPFSSYVPAPISGFSCVFQQAAQDSALIKCRPKLHTPQGNLEKKITMSHSALALWAGGFLVPGSR